MNFTKFDKSGPNLQRLNFEKFEKRRSGSRWFWVVGTKDYLGELVWDKNQNRKRGSFVNLQEVE